MKVLALSVTPYDFQDETTKRQISGCNLEVVSDYSFPSEDQSSGHPAMKMPMPTELATGLKGKLPAVVEINTTVKKGSGGKATVTITSLGSVVPFNLLNVLSPKS